MSLLHIYQTEFESFLAGFAVVETPFFIFNLLIFFSQMFGQFVSLQIFWGFVICRLYLNAQEQIYYGLCQLFMKKYNSHKSNQVVCKI